MVYQLPPYASELNPLVEPETVAGQPHQAEHRSADRAVKTRLRRMQYRRRLLEGFLAKTGLDLNTLRL
jgi:putative transposase